MRKISWLTVAAVFLATPVSWCGQADQKPAQAQSPATTDSVGQSSQAAPTQQDSLAAAARKAREQKKESTKPAKVFTNDDIPSSGGTSSIGEASTAPVGQANTEANAANDEKSWRDKFSKLHHKLDQDKQELDVMQRELGVLQVQYYNDPVKAMQQQLTRGDINDKTAKIDAKKKEIDADQQAIDDAEDDLRKAGGDPGWAR